MNAKNRKENRPAFRTPSFVKKKDRLRSDLKYYDNADMMRVFKVSTRTLQRWRDDKIIPFKKIGGKIYYDPQKVAEMMEEDEEE